MYHNHHHHHHVHSWKYCSVCHVRYCEDCGEEEKTYYPQVTWGQYRPVWDFGTITCSNHTS